MVRTIVRRIEKSESTQLCDSYEELPKYCVKIVVRKFSLGLKDPALHKYMELMRKLREIISRISCVYVTKSLYSFTWRITDRKLCALIATNSCGIAFIPLDSKGYTIFEKKFTYLWK